MKLTELLSFDFASGRLLDKLEDFDMKVNEYEKESKETLSDNMRIGVVIKGMERITEGASSTTQRTVYDLRYIQDGG